MKHLILLTLIAAIIVPASSLLAEEKSHEETIDALEKRMKIQQMEMEIQGQRSEFEFEQQMRQIELDRHRAELENQERQAGSHGQKHHEGCGIFILICLVVHILAAIWVYLDIRNRKKGSGLWIVIAILTGLLGTLVYAVVRIGDAKKTA